MSYAIMRMAKMTRNSIVASQKHNERENENYSNLDIEKELTKDNYHLIDDKRAYLDIVDERIKEGYKKEKAIRKDAVYSTEFIFTSDEEFFKKLSPEDEKKYFEKSLEFLKDEFGEKNVVTAVVHKDEKTPHLHAIIVPINNEGNLSMKSFVDGAKDLTLLQDKYLKKVSEHFPQLERGQSKEITKAKHKDLKQLKKETNYLDEKLAQALEKKKEVSKKLKITNEIPEIVKAIQEREETSNLKKVFFKVPDEQREYKITGKELSKISEKALQSEEFGKYYARIKKEKEGLEKQNETLGQQLEQQNELKKQNLDLSKELEQEKSKFNKILNFVKNKDLLEELKEFLKPIEKQLTKENSWNRKNAGKGFER